MKPNGIQAYVEHEARAAGLPPGPAVQPVHKRPVPPLSDPVATTIRAALDLRKLAQLEELFAGATFQAGEPIEVEEHREPVRA